MTKRIVLVGAARSGTKIVRDVLAEATRAGRVPYDVGFVWRYRNERATDDVLDPSAITPSIQRFIRSYVDGYAAGQSSPIVLEKSVGNALRVPFVHAVLPDAVFVHLIRDGFDVAESTRRQWLSPPDRRYLAQKLRHFPVRLLPSYGRKYATSQLRRYLRKDSRIGTWGPRYPGIDEDVESNELLSVCALQWHHAVEYASDALAKIGAQSVALHYERLVARPRDTLERLLSELELDTAETDLQRAAAMLEPGHVHRAEHSLSQQEIQQVQRSAGATLARFGYPRDLSWRKP